MFSNTKRRPYITCQSELELYNNQKNSIYPSDEGQLNYKNLKGQNKHFILRDYGELTFYDILLWICNDDLHLIANEGVYYLMTFISLGILSVQFNENVEFVKIELKYILQNKLLEKLKERINVDSYIEMQQDLNDIQRHFGI